MYSLFLCVQIYTMYTVDVNSKEPIMLLNKQIGASFNEDGTSDGIEYIDGAKFQEELMYLDTLGKKRIQVYICSEGGSVLEAMKICGAILKTNTPVDTYNTGLCASSAGLIFMCGRKRIMSDYSLFMAHPVSGGNEKSTNAFTSSISSIISQKSGIDNNVVGYMMASTTWLGASDCFANGICTEIEVTKESNVKYMPSETKAMLEYCNKLTNEFIDFKIINMDLKQITNKLNLVDGADINLINNAIDAIVTARNDAQQEAQTASEKVADLEAQLQTAKAELDEANKAKQEAEEAQAETEATEVVNKYSERIGNDAEVKAVWINLYKANKETTVKMLDSIPLNKVANRAETGDAPTQKTSMESVMMNIQAKQLSNKQN